MACADCIPLLLVLTGLMACTTDPGYEEPPPQNHAEAVAVAPAPSIRTYTHTATEFRFDLPSELRVQHRRFDTTTTAHKVKERFEVKGNDRLLSRIDVWKNADDLSLDTWVETYGSYLKRGGSSTAERKVGRSQVRALVFDTPRSCQAPNVITAVFALDDRIVSVTCPNGEDEAARTAFDLAIASISLEVRR